MSKKHEKLYYTTTPKNKPSSNCPTRAVKWPIKTTYFDLESVYCEVRVLSFRMWYKCIPVNSMCYNS